jgi:hypothetical protein
MLIATFGPTTAWQGKRITWEEGAFMLEGHGIVTAAEVMEYDRQGHLKWDGEGTRAWVGSRAALRDSAPRSTERTALLKRILLVAIIALLVVNLVLLVVTAHFVHVLP